MDILGLIAQLEEVVEFASTIPFSAKIVIDKEEISEIIRKINVAIPEEVRRARWIKNEKDQIIIEAKKEAEEMVKTAQEEQDRLVSHAKYEENRVIEDARSLADELISEHEITNLAENHCRTIVREAEETAKEIKDGAYAYVDAMLKELEYKLKDYVTTVTHNRSELNKYANSDE